ncbi:SDR family oxidoreductase [Ferruginibacter lapsinanis]|uniref:SDR family oxidoreductase n=1 Tax=Ferruginibacter lapsinanis TaxID=563172 RepID=UPI001E452553|nr:SDR family oxidoreductase [Ferruginibacter lapsinanis]UEG48483.1 SDR family oxidoreductase [Ferruginibacter lapsinanis]
MNNIFHTKDLANYSFLVTGGAGFIGSHIAEYLLRNGAKKVRVLDNMENGFESNLHILRQYPGFEFISGDIRNAEICNQACIGIDYVSHQAALGSVPRSIAFPSVSTEVNVSGFVNMLKAAVDNKVKQVVYASSSSVYGDEKSLPKIESRVGNCLSPYAVSKKTNELYAQVFAGVYGLNLIGLRYFNVFGPRQDPDGQYAAVIPLFVKGIIKKTPVFINGDGEQTRDFTFVDNAVQMNIRAMLSGNPESMNKVYNVAIGENFSINKLYTSCKEYLESDFEPTYREARQGDVRDSLADISLAKKMLGYVPTKKFDDGLIETIEYFKNLYTAKHSSTI